MTDLEIVQQRVADIEACKGDDEGAHGMEDRLWEDVLVWIAGGHKDAAKLAAEALKTRSIIFERWCA